MDDREPAETSSNSEPAVSPPSPRVARSTSACTTAPPPPRTQGGLFPTLLLLGCLVAGVASLVTGPSIPKAETTKDEYEIFGPADRFAPGLRPEGVAVVRLDGAISFEAPGFSGSKGADRIIRLLHKIAKASSVKAVVLRINSPGGTVAASQEIADAVRTVRKAGKKVVVSMADMAASGGYYISAPADWVIALPGTITGSIGVITQLPRYKEIANKVGYKIKAFTSGQFKDMGNPFRDLREDESQLFKKLVMDSYLQFVEEVAQGRAGPILSKFEESQNVNTWQEPLDKIRAGEDTRPLTDRPPLDLAPGSDTEEEDSESATDLTTSSKEALKEATLKGEEEAEDAEAPEILTEEQLGQVRKRVSEIADGRIYTGTEALRLGLVDQIGGLRDAIRKAGELSGLGPDPTLLTPKSSGDIGSFFQLLGKAPEGVQGQIQKTMKSYLGVSPPASLPANVPVAYMYMPGN